MDIAGSPDPGEVEWLEPEAGRRDGDVIDTRRARPPWRWKWWYALVGVLALALIVVAVPPRGGDHSATAVTSHPATSVSVSPVSPAPPTPSLSYSNVGPPVVTATQLPRPLLDVPSTWELFARGPEFIERVQLSTGRVTTTTLPDLGSSGPVTMIAGPDRVIVGPLDNEPGYVIEDAKPATPLVGALASATVMLPGPDRNHLWIQSGGNDSVRLVGFDGKVTAVSVPMPSGASSPIADGAGYLLFPSIDGLFAARPGVLHRLTTGQLIAVGPKQWLVVECDDSLHCAMNSVDRATESRRRVSGDVFAYQFYGGGTISPDGQTAALFGGTGNDENTLHLLDLRTGRDLDTKTAVGQDGVYDGGGAVWSPDSRWVFTQSSNGKVVAVERSSATAHQLTLPGVPVTQVALRVDQPTS